MVTTEPERVPVRTILATIGLLLGTGLAVLFVIQVQRVLVWMLVAGFFTVTLYPVVAWVQRRLSWCPRWLATLLVFLLVFLVLGGLLAVFAVPLAQEGIQLAGQLPGIVADARAGRGPVGELLTRTNALQWVQDNLTSPECLAASSHVEIHLALSALDDPDREHGVRRPGDHGSCCQPRPAWWQCHGSEHPVAGP